jgi:hypothetical protein
MDPETLRLLITTLGVVAAATIGATVTGGIARTNAREALDEERDKWDRERAKEHSLWLRERKSKAYVAYLQMMTGFLNEWNTAGPAGKAEVSLIHSFLARYKQADMSLVAPTEVNQHATELADATFSFMDDILTGGHKKALPNMQRREIAYAKLLHGMREDLEIGSGEDLSALETEEAKANLVQRFR